MKEEIERWKQKKEKESPFPKDIRRFTIINADSGERLGETSKAPWDPIPLEEWEEEVSRSFAGGLKVKLISKPTLPTEEEEAE